MVTFLCKIMKNYVKLFIIILSLSFFIFLFPSEDSKEPINPYFLPFIGIAVVFVGLLIMQIFINLLKHILNVPIKELKDKKTEDFNKSILEKIELNEEELTAITTALILEHKLYHSVSNEKLTIKWEDKPPYWFYARS